MTTTEPAPGTVYTIGHSTRPVQALIDMLTAHGITALVDVRTVPRSRHNPQFDSDALAAALADVDIDYAHAAGLGGFRRTSAESPNTGWRNSSFRGYADYMLTAEFAENAFWLSVLAQQERVAIMCAEAVPWRCHRSLIADWLTVQGTPTEEIVSSAKLQAHKLTPFARVDDGRITYPPEAAASE